LQFKEHLTEINDKLDKIDSKLDNHLERIAKVEQLSTDNSGLIKVIFSALVTIILGLLGVATKFITWKG
jgi:hypothetical protein